MTNAEHREQVADLKTLIAEASGTVKELGREKLRSDRLRARLERIELLLERTTDEAAKSRLLREQKRRKAELAFRALKVEELQEALDAEDDTEAAE